MQHNEANHKHSLRMCLASRFSRNQCCSSKAFYTCAQSLFLSESDSQLLNALVMVSFSPTLNCSMPFVMVPCGACYRFSIVGCSLLLWCLQGGCYRLSIVQCSLLWCLQGACYRLSIVQCSLLWCLCRACYRCSFLWGWEGGRRGGGCN
jgi:hypothetical protein